MLLVLINICVFLKIVPLTNGLIIIPPAQKVVGGYTGFTPSVRLSIRPSGIPCPLCSAYSFGWIHFIFIHLIEQLQKVCRMLRFLQNIKICNLCNFFKICNYDFVFFWFGIWCESLVWFIMGRQGVSQNACSCSSYYYYWLMMVWHWSTFIEVTEIMRMIPIQITLCNAMQI